MNHFEKWKLIENDTYLFQDWYKLFNFIKKNMFVN